MNSIYDLVRTNTIFTIKPDWISDPDRSIIPDRDLYTNASGTVQIDTLDVGIVRSMSYQYSCLNKEQQSDLEEFFFQRKGRYDRFWMPIWGNLFRLENPITAYDLSIIIQDCGLSESVVNGQDRLYIELHDGSIITRKISSVIDLGNGTERINLVTYMDQDIVASDIAQFTRLLLCRFNQDELSFQYENTDIAITNLNMIELTQEYQLPEES